MAKFSTFTFLLLYLVTLEIGIFVLASATIATTIIERPIHKYFAGYVNGNDPNLIFTVAGNDELNLQDGLGTAASFSDPFGIASDYFSKYLYVSDTSAIRRFNRATSEVTTLNSG